LKEAIVTSVGAADVMAIRNAVLQRNAALRDAAARPLANTVQTTDTARVDGVAAGSPSFATTFQNALQQVNTLQEQEDVATEAYERGETTDIASVVLMQQRASISFEATLQVRNKLLSAYKDIMNMPV
jgi:flagellar hook-basal body complex protein FliE